MHLPNYQPTITNQDKQPPVTGQPAKHNHQEKVKYDSLTQHPTECREKQVVQEKSNKQTSTLGIGRDN